MLEAYQAAAATVPLAKVKRILRRLTKDAADGDNQAARVLLAFLYGKDPVGLTRILEERREARAHNHMTRKQGMALIVALNEAIERAVFDHITFAAGPRAVLGKITAELRRVAGGAADVIDHDNHNTDGAGGIDK
jgi:hypothetical protein